MKKIVAVIGILILIAIALPLLGFAVSIGIGVAMTYFGATRMLKANSIGGKIVWGLLTLAGLSVLLGHFPLVISLGAAVILYYIFKTYQGKKRHEDYSYNQGSFSNFEEEWKDVFKK